MGQSVDFPSNGHTCQGYLATPATGRGPAVVVIQEWWGLVPHIKSICDRLASEGFVAIAPDLYHGKATTSPDEAGKLLMELDVIGAERDIAGAGHYAMGRAEPISKSFGVIGFCMGGALAQFAASKNRDVSAAVSFYGGFKRVRIDWQDLSAALLLIYAGKDRGVPAGEGRELVKTLKGMGKHVQMIVYPDADHGFFNEARPSVHKPEAAADAWHKTLAFLRHNVE